MKRFISLALAGAAMAVLPIPAAATDVATDHAYGPPPSWEQYRQIAEADIAARLLDPESARFTWMGGYVKSGFKSWLRGNMAGYFACGRVNAKNRMGGYTGAMTFLVVVDYDRVLFVELDRSASGGFAAQRCNQAVAAGRFPPLPAAGAAAVSGSAPGGAPAAATAMASGLQLRAMPDGAYISAVAPGSPAATAGLKPGMVIASVNAIPLASMGDAMLKVIEAAGADAALAIVGGPTVKLGGAR